MNSGAGHGTGVMENGSAKRVKLGHSSIFDGLAQCPPDPIFFVKDSYNADKDPKKVNLGIGGENTSNISMVTVFNMIPGTHPHHHHS